VASPRAIRIPRPKSPDPAPPGAGALPVGASPSPAPPAKVDRRPNQAATERARRLALLYIGMLVVLYGAFVVLDRSAPGGTSASAATGLLYFSAFAAILGVGGLWVALSPAPRAIEVRPDSVTVIEAWGVRRAFPPLGELRPTLVRHYPGSFLSSRAVDTLELTDSTGHRRTYQFEEGLIPTGTSAVRLGPTAGS